MIRIHLTIELEVLGDVRDPVALAHSIVTRQGFRVVDARPAPNGSAEPQSPRPPEPASPPAQRDLFDPKEPPC